MMKHDRLSIFTPLIFTLTMFFSVAAVFQSSPPEMPLATGHADGDSLAAAVDRKSGELLYLEACAACHGAGGRGTPQSQLGFETPMPDFTDCDFASREPDADWIAVAHQGGPTRGFSTDMPAFGEALSVEELQEVMNHVRTFCTDKNWPRGELNLPRPLVTEKAFPEDEAVLSSSIDLENEGGIMNKLVYEHRFGARNQLELVVPFGYLETPGGGWIGGNLGDVAVGVKRALWHNLESGSIFSVTGEVIMPTGEQSAGFGKGTVIFEPFISYGQFLPAGSFLQIQSGVEIPALQDKAENEAFWRAALGTSLTQGRWGRVWSPMVEILGSTELEPGAPVHWDLVPQMQVTLNKRQHVMMNVGVRIPADDPSRDTQLMVYILWDWFDGGFFEGW